MALKTIKSLILGGVVVVASVSGLAFAAGGGGTGDYKMKHPDWSFKGAFGTYDRAATQRGYQVYNEVCAQCHTLKYMAFRHLGDKGGPFYLEDYPNPSDNPYVKNFAATWQIPDIDADTGDEITRKGTPADYFPRPAGQQNDAAARAANGGSLPPDLSSMVKARGGGADYVYNLLIAYDSPKPDDVVLTPGLHYNPVMDGAKIAMAAPLSADQVSYDPVQIEDHGEITTIDGPPATVEQMAADVTHFLAWAADPKLEQRKSIGMMTILYLLILSVLLFFAYKRVWRDVEH